jgi:hypothetical protein
MSCIYSNSCGKICPRFVVTTAVAFTAGSLVLTLPDDVSYDNGEKYCIVVGQTIPAATTLNAPVVAVVGDGTTQFPLITRCGAPVVSQQIITRIKYPVCVTTSSTGGTLRVLRCLPEVEVFTLNSLNDAGGGA